MRVSTPPLFSPSSLTTRTFPLLQSKFFFNIQWRCEGDLFCRVGNSDSATEDCVLDCPKSSKESDNCVKNTCCGPSKVRVPLLSNKDETDFTHLKQEKLNIWLVDV